MAYDRALDVGYRPANLNIVGVENKFWLRPYGLNRYAIAMLAGFLLLLRQDSTIPTAEKVEIPDLRLQGTNYRIG